MATILQLWESRIIITYAEYLNSTFTENKDMITIETGVDNWFNSCESYIVFGYGMKLSTHK